MKSFLKLFKEAYSSLLLEGGHAFPNVSRINQENVESTLQDIFDRLLPEIKLSKEDVAVLGSAGKKLPGTSSGDIDLALEKEKLLKKNNIHNEKEYIEWAKKLAKKLNVETSIAEQYGYNSVSLRWPISNSDGKQENQFVQLDFVVPNNIDFAKWGMWTPQEVKGEENPKTGVKNSLLMAIGRSREKVLDKADIPGEGNVPVKHQRYDYIFNQGLFLVTRERKKKKKGDGYVSSWTVSDKKFLTDDPKEITKKLFGPSTDPKDVMTVKGAWNELKKTELWKNPDTRKKLAHHFENDLARHREMEVPSYIRFDESIINLLTEGGNAFLGVSRINRKNVESTVEDFIDKVSKGLKIDKKQIALIGSAGKKDTSGDIDVGVGNVSDISGFLEKAKKFFDENKIEARIFSGIKIISTKWPIKDEDGMQKDQFVQIDLMPTTRLDFISWGTYSPKQEDSKYKGVVRNLLICDIAQFTDIKVLETEVVDGKELPAVIERYSLSTTEGLFRKKISYRSKRKPNTLIKTGKTESKEFISDDPKKIVKILFTNNTVPDDCLTIDGVWEQFKKTDAYKNKDLRNKILTKTTTELKDRGLEYPSYMDPQ